MSATSLREKHSQEPWFSSLAHPGFQQLAIICEKQGNLEEALRLAEEAKRQGCREMGHGDWSKRCARLEKRIAKS